MNTPQDVQNSLNSFIEFRFKALEAVKAGERVLALETELKGLKEDNGVLFKKLDSINAWMRATLASLAIALLMLAFDLLRPHPPPH